MLNGMIRAPFSTWARRGVLVVIVAIGLVIAWSYTGLATMITDYTIGNDGVVRSDAYPTPQPTPAGRAYQTAPSTGNSSPTNAMAKTTSTTAPQTNAGGHKRMVKGEPPYTVTRVKNVFTVSRNGTPWVVLTQGSGSIIVGDPSRTSPGVVDITLAKPGSTYK
jgi:hypothetical protein